MKTVVVCLTALACGLTLLGNVEAQVCHAPVRTVVSSSYTHVPVVKKVVVEEKIIVPTFQYALVIPVVTFPSYGAGIYTPPPVAAPGTLNTAPPPAQAPQVNPDGLKAVMDALKAIDARLQKLEGNTQPPAQQKPKDPFNPQALRQETGEKAAKVVSRACMSCHDQPVAAEKGGGFAMSDKDGYLATLNAKDVAKVQKRVDNGSMPPKDSKIVLTDEEKAALKAHYKD